MRRTANLITFTLIIGFYAVAGTIGLAAEPMDVVFRAKCDGSEQRYVLLLPPEFDAGKPTDLLVALHGHGSDRWQYIRSKRPETRAKRDAAAMFNMILVSPDYRARTSWMGPKAEADMLQILDKVQTKYKIRHTIISGGSMGGSSSLTFAALHPERVDGVVSVNGLANHVEYKNFQDAIQKSFGGTKQEVPEEYRRRSAELWPDRLTMPIAATVGDRDKSVPPDSVRRLIGVLKKKGRPVLLIDRPQMGHSTNYDDNITAFRFVVEKVRAAKAQDETKRRAAARRSIVLPDYCNTPDAMALLADGNIILSVPNFTDPTSPGVLMKISPDDKVSLFYRLPPHPATGRVYPMGIRQAPSGDLYLADCQALEEKKRQSRLLRVVMKDGKPVGVKTVAEGFDMANGVAIRDGYAYLTDSAIGKSDDGSVTSAVYRFRLDEEDVKIEPEGKDPHLVTTLKTYSKEIPVGADGIDFDENGNLYVANCGDATIEKIVMDKNGRVTSQAVLAKSPLMKSVDGIFYDRATRSIYVADILANAIQTVSLDGKVKVVAQNGDSDGSDGLLDGPSEAVVRNGEIIAANFDRVFPGAVNTKPDKPYTLSIIRCR
ncbi:MAG: alpha/beta fold hydrolase [Planctomycetota bacterium]|nr:alpha/beta fold hydrolase [Planctomycetota bacterium]